jgi:hypothetical protein
MRNPLGLIVGVAVVAVGLLPGAAALGQTRQSESAKVMITIPQ